MCIEWAGRGGKTPQRSLFPRKCLGCGTDGSGKRKWEEGRLRERGRWLQECDPESWSWPRGFPERFLPPSSLSPAACRSQAFPAPARAAPSPAQTGLVAKLPPVTSVPRQLSGLRPSGSGFHFPHLMWGNPKTGTSPPSCPPTPRLRLFVPQQTHTFYIAQTSPWRCTEWRALARPGQSGCLKRDPLDPLPCWGQQDRMLHSLLLIQELLFSLPWHVQH